MTRPVVIGSKEDGRQVTCHSSGRASYRFWYVTTLGPNSAGYSREFDSQAAAVEAAMQWVNERSENG